MTISNTDGTAPADRALEDGLMPLLPQQLRHWLMYDAPWDANVRQVAELVRDRVPLAQIMYQVRTAQRRDTAKVYGRAHPQAAQF